MRAVVVDRIEFLHNELAKTREALKYVTSAIAAHLSCRCSGMCAGLIRVVDQAGGGWKQGTMDSGELFWTHRTLTGDDGKALHAFDSIEGHREKMENHVIALSTAAQVFTRSPLTLCLVCCAYNRRDSAHNQRDRDQAHSERGSRTNSTAVGSAADRNAGC